MSIRKHFTVAGIVLLTLLIIISVFTGCKQDGQNIPFGDISITLPSRGAPMGSSADLVGEIETYTITLTFQSDTSYTHTKTIDKDNPTAQFPDLLPGTWNVAVDGFNVADEKVATGTTSVLVESGKTKTVQITLVRAGESGILKVNTTWTDELVKKDDVTITVTVGHVLSQDTGNNITMIKSDTAASASGQITLSEGNYRVAVTFEDKNNVYSDGRTEVVQVLADGETNASFDFPLSVGGLNVEIQNPNFGVLDLSITGIGNARYVTVGSTVTLTVSGISTPDIYQWYQNGKVLPNETSSTLTLLIDESKTYSLTCVVTDGGVSDSATVEFASVVSTEELKGSAGAKFSEARMLIETMLSEKAPVINTKYLYNLLTEAVALNPDNMDAVFTLGMFDLVKFLLDDEIQTVMREGIGFTSYPSTEQELYANIISIIYGFVPNGYNNFLTNHTYQAGTENEYTMFIPVLSGYMVSDGEGPAYLLQMFSNLAAKGYDIDDVFDGILDSLGRSFDRTVNNVSSLTDDARSLVTTEDGVSHYITKAEAQLIASQLYAIRAFASLFNAIELGFDIENILSSITYDASTGSIEFATPAASPFANGFLQADSEKGLAYIESAKEDILKANELMSEALDAIAARTDADTDLLVSPASDFLFENTSNGWTPKDMSLSWDEFKDVLAVTNILLAKEKASIEAGGGTKVVIPIDIMECIQEDSNYDIIFTDFAPIFALYSETANWPNEASMDLDTGLNAVAIDAGIVFRGEFNLLATILEIDRATGEPVLYYYNEGNDSFSVATAYRQGEYAYIKIPDITLGGFIDKANSPYTWSEMEKNANPNPSPFNQDVFKIREDGDAVAVYVLEQIFSNRISYPLSYHALTPVQLSPSDVLVKFHTDFQNRKTGEYIVTKSIIPIASTGSFWLGAIEAIKYAMSLNRQDLRNLYDLDGPVNDSEEHAYQLDQYVEVSFRWDSDYNTYMADEAWFSFTPEKDGIYCIEVNSWNGMNSVFHDGNQETTIYGKNSLDLHKGVTYYVQFKKNSSSDYFGCELIWYEEDNGVDNYSNASAKMLDVDIPFEGITYQQNDHFKITPTTDQISISLEFADPFVADSSSFGWSLGYAYLSGGTYNYTEIEYEDSPLTFDVTAGEEYCIVIWRATYLNYTLQWNDIGEVIL